MKKKNNNNKCIKLFSTLLHLPGVGGRVVTGAGRASRGSRPTWRTPPPRPRPFTRNQVFQGRGGLYLYRAQAGAVRSSHASTKYALLDIQRELLVDVKTRIYKVDGSVSCPEGGGSALGKETTSH